MTNEIVNFEGGVSARTTDSGLRYLSNCGVYEEPALVLFDEFVQHMLETTVADSGAIQRPVTAEMRDRAIEYFSLYFDPQNPQIITDRKFVHGLLTYALLGRNVYFPPKVSRTPVSDGKKAH
jgi:hypothetical protein